MKNIIIIASTALFLIGCSNKPPEMSDNAKRYQAIIDNTEIQPPTLWRGTVWGVDDDKSIRACAKLAQLANLADKSGGGRGAPKNQTEWENLVVLQSSGSQLISTPECVGNRTKWRNNYTGAWDGLRTLATEVPDDIKAAGDAAVSQYRWAINRGVKSEELLPHHKTLIDMVRINSLGMPFREQYSKVYVPTIQMPR